MPSELVSPAPPSTFEAIDTLIRVVEVDTAEFYVGDLFRRHFGGDPPDYPRHFVALYKASRSAFVALGYLHYTTFDDIALAGGLLVDERARVRMPAAHQALLRDAGGIAATLFRLTFPRFAALPALWAHIGDREVRETFGCAGFAAADDPHIMVRWNRDVDAVERAARIAHIRSLGAF
jgi:hypothetical protein